MQVTNNDKVARYVVYKVNGQVKRVKIPGLSSVELPDLTSKNQVIFNQFDLKVNKINFGLGRGILGDLTIGQPAVIIPPEPTFDIQITTYEGDPLVPNRASVSDWNTFFDLPNNGTPFTSVSIINVNQLRLFGASNITVKENLFKDKSILGFADSGCIKNVSIGSFDGCATNLMEFPEITTIPNNAFFNSGNFNIGSFPKVTTIGENGLNGSIANNATLPLLTSIQSTSLQNFATEYLSLPIITTLPDGCFDGMGQGFLTDLTINLPMVTSMGSTTGDDGVFANISGANITLTVPAALMTCNGGQPDGDIQYLIDNNTVTIIQV